MGHQPLGLRAAFPKQASTRHCRCCCRSLSCLARAPPRAVPRLLQRGGAGGAGSRGRYAAARPSLRGRHRAPAGLHAVKVILRAGRGSSSTQLMAEAAAAVAAAVAAANYSACSKEQTTMERLQAAAAMATHGMLDSSQPPAPTWHAPMSPSLHAMQSAKALAWSAQGACSCTSCCAAWVAAAGSGCRLPSTESTAGGAAIHGQCGKQQLGTHPAGRDGSCDGARRAHLTTCGALCTPLCPAPDLRCQSKLTHPRGAPGRCRCPGPCPGPPFRRGLSACRRPAGAPPAAAGLRRERRARQGASDAAARTRGTT